MKAFITFLIAVSLITLSNKMQAQSEAAVGDKAPGFSLELLGGGNFTLADQKGKVVFIFFFGYACPHCLSNGPNTQSGIYEVYQSNSEFVAVGIDTWDGNSSGVTSYRNSTGISYPLCLMGSDVESAYQTTYDRMVVVDKDGVIRYKATSNATEGVVSDASEVIATYLDKEPMGMMGDGGGDGGDGGGDGGDGGGDGGTVTSTEEDNPEKLALFPVPACEELTLSGTLLNHENFQVRIINLLGKVNYEGSFTHREELNLPVSQLTEGIYLVQLIASGESYTKRLVIRR